MIGLSNIEGAGYTMAKWGAVALARSFASSRPNPYKADGVKSYAICPWFADTALVRNVTSLAKIERVTKHRVLTVEDVGQVTRRF